MTGLYTIFNTDSNDNGRMYDPLTASFLSPDNNVQDPTTQQGFNRYAYCAYNPLKYVDPSGYRYYGYDEGACYRMIDEMTRTIQREWHLVYESAMESVQLTISMACCLYGYGQDTHGNGSGNHGSPGGGSSPNGSSGNGNVDGDPTNNTTNSNGRPGDSPDNPISADYLFDICDIRYFGGENKPLYVDASTIDLYFLTQGDLTSIGDDLYTINLFTFPYMFKAPQLSLALGQITLKYVGDNMYEIFPDKFDFNVPDGEYLAYRSICRIFCLGMSL